MELNCVLLADGISQGDNRLDQEAGGRPRALIPIAGKAMGQWVLDALTGAMHVGKIVVVGLSEDDGLTSPKIAVFVPDQGRFLANVVAGLEQIHALQAQEGHVLLCTTEIPMMIPEIVDRVVEDWATLHETSKADMYYHVVPRSLMEARFPGADRKYIRLLEDDFAGANLHVVATNLRHRQKDLWGSLLDSREHVLQQAIRLGGDFFFKLMTRRLSLEELESRSSARVGIRIKMVPSGVAEIGMEVDRPARLDICRAELSGKGASG